MIAVALGAVAALVTLDLLRRHAPSRPHRAIRPLPRQARRALVGVGVVVGLLVAPPVPIAIGIALVTRRQVQRRRRARLQSRQVARSLPDVVELLLLATGAGLALPVAHPLIARHAPPPLADALRAALQLTDAGQPRADAILEALAPLGDPARSLAEVLADHLRYGVPLVPGLERLHLEMRLARRRAAETDARKVPVRLLAPLVTCVLPAFALLTVVPLLAASLEALPT